MRSRAAAVVCAAIVVSLTTAQGVAHADEKKCVLDQVSGVLECSLVASPAPARTVRLSTDLPLVWTRVPFDVGERTSRGIGCVRDVAGIHEIGAGYAISLINTATSEHLYLDHICTWPGELPPEPPPPPPTPAELAEANTRALMVSPVASPAGAIGGLTGLESWFWCDDPGTVATGVSLRGWIAEGGVEVVQLGWEIDGPGSLVDTSTACGSEEAPSVAWTPATKGDYGVVLTAVWAGTWDLTWNGIPMGTFPLGPISLTSPAQQYPVDEYRGELTG